jgi:UDPglucose 6-dehydrogenase
MPLDICATDFLERFDISKCTVGVVGHGFVGKAVESFFRKICNVLVYDKAEKLDTLGSVVLNSEVIFVCVPTPMRADGSCYTGIIEEVLRNIQNTALDEKRSPDGFVVVLKSTVSPGFTDRMKKEYSTLKILFCPEFLTEKNSIADFENTNRIILGGELEDARVVFKFFEAKFPQKVEDGRLIIAVCPPSVAEMVKLYTNGMLMTKVLFSNEIYQICQLLGIDYNDVRVLACLDQRIGSSHTLVPGPDGQLGAGGHCFPKDMNNLRYICKTVGIGERVISAVLDRNDDLRQDKDWLDMKGRAVIDE